MPGPAAHLSIIELQTAKAVANLNRYGAVGSALSKHPRHAQFGSIGPDMLFWADWNSYTPIVNTIFDLYHTLDLIYDKLAALWQPISDAIDKVMDSLTGGLAGSISDTVSYLSGIINTAMLDLITYEVDYWQTLKPHFQSHSPHDPEKNWNWLDYTHHRYTGAFTKRLIAHAKASGDASLQAYAYGWLSHVTADVVGHAYVNLAVGGPWRTHFQRHHLQENFMDVWSWGFYHTPGVSMPASAPSGALPFNYSTFTNLSTANLQDMIDLGEDLPDNLQVLITETLTDIYLPVTHPTIIPFLGKTEINRAYQMQKMAFEIMTKKDRHLGPPKVPKVFGDMEPPTYPGSGGTGSGSSGSSGGSNFSLVSLLQAIWDFIKDTLTYLNDLALWLVSKITSLLTYPVRYALYLMQLGLYEVYRAFRWALVVSAYVYPDVDQLSDPFAQQFINPSLTLMLQAPHMEYPLEKDHSLFYPLSSIEQMVVIPGPYGHDNLNYPYWFIEGEPSDLAMEQALINSSTPAATAEITSVLQQNTKNSGGYRGSLGSALDFYLRHAEEIHAADGDSSKLQLPDWNIDADRGYGFKCWEAASKLDPQPPSGVQVKYL
jgi:hypothetical protein